MTPTAVACQKFKGEIAVVEKVYAHKGVKGGKGIVPLSAIKPGEVRNPAGRAKGSLNNLTLERQEIFEKHVKKAIDVYIDTIDATKWEQVVAVGPDDKPILEPQMRDGRPVLDEHGVPRMLPRLAWKKVPLYPNEQRQRAADAILDRRYGKPTQHANVEGNGNTYIAIMTYPSDKDL